MIKGEVGKGGMGQITFGGLYLLMIEQVQNPGIDFL
jgi:hypothetical protein